VVPWSRRCVLLRLPITRSVAPVLALLLIMLVEPSSSATSSYDSIVPSKPLVSSYDSIVLSEPSIVMYLSGSMYGSAIEPDLTGHGHSGTYFKGGTALRTLTLPDGGITARYNGESQHLDVADADALSVTTTGQLTIEAWIRPDTTSMPTHEDSGYVNWMGKGADGEYEYVNRMYQDGNRERRANRVSGYVFNRTGGFGVGGYFQDQVRTTQWMQVTTVIDLTNHSRSRYGLIRIYKNAVLRQTNGLSQSYATISAPGNGTAPLRIATGDLSSYFKGGIGKVAIFKAALAPTQIAAHYKAMCPSGARTPGCS
jgi:hypothetical protein